MHKYCIYGRAHISEMGMSVCACIPRSVLMMVVLIIKMEVTGDSGGAVFVRP